MTEKIEIWKKILVVAGTATQIIGSITNSKNLIIIGGISVIVGTIALFLFKKW